MSVGWWVRRVDCEGCKAGEVSGEVAWPQVGKVRLKSDQFI